jgi:hypothetical protein
VHLLVQFSQVATTGHALFLISGQAEEFVQVKLSAQRTNEAKIQSKEFARQEISSPQFIDTSESTLRKRLSKISMGDQLLSLITVNQSLN